MVNFDCHGDHLIMPMALVGHFSGCVLEGISRKDWLTESGRLILGKRRHALYDGLQNK